MFTQNTNDRIHKYCANKKDIYNFLWLKMWTNARSSTTTNNNNNNATRWDINKHETIHSGHFMVSTFEADAQDEEDNEIEMPDPDIAVITEINPPADDDNSYLLPVPVKKINSNAVIDISLTKLFKCMNLAYK